MQLITIKKKFQNIFPHGNLPNYFRSFFILQSNLVARKAPTLATMQQENNAATIGLNLFSIGLGVQQSYK